MNHNGVACVVLPLLPLVAVVVVKEDLHLVEGVADREGNEHHELFEGQAVQVEQITNDTVARTHVAVLALLGELKEIAKHRKVVIGPLTTGVRQDLHHGLSLTQPRESDVDFHGELHGGVLSVEDGVEIRIHADVVLTAIPQP